MDVRSPFFQCVAQIVAGVLFLNPIVASAAELTLDAAAGGNASLGQAGNGVPVVNIATPNARGLSHNRFSDYNVGQQGLILNNSGQGVVSTQLGGHIVGNGNLQKGSAGLILNEVTGGNRSQLKGYTEVAGQSAAVIVANPHGISCDGCGFLNTPYATLTTGTPVVENGRLSRYDVDGGDIAIEGAGLNASNLDQFDLITRSARINAELHANRLNIVAGRNQVDAASLAASAKADDGSAKPSLAIDSSALGGMYAGAIRLVGTEAGVGVKLAGDLAASAGDIHIDANGQLTLARTAASGDLALQARDIALNDGAYAGGSASVRASDHLDIERSLAAAGDVRVEGQRIVNRGNLEAGVEADGGTNPAAHLAIEGGSLSNQGRILAQGSLDARLQALDNRGAELLAAGGASLVAERLDNQGGHLIGRRDLDLSGTSLDNRGGTLASNGRLVITARGEVRNGDDGLILAQADGLGIAAGSLDNQGGTVQANSGELSLRTDGALDNRGGQLLTGAGALSLAADRLDNGQGVVEAQGGALTLHAQRIDNTQGHLQAERVVLTVGDRLTNDRGRIAARAGNLDIAQGDIDNRAGWLGARDGLRLDAASLDNRGGSIGAGLIELSLGGELNNAGGLVEAGQTLSIAAFDLGNAGGKLRALGASGSSAFTLGGRFDNDAGLVEIGNASLRLRSAGLSNQGGTVRHVGTGAFDLTLADLGAAGGRFLTNGELNLNAASWTNTSELQAERLTLNIGQFTQTAAGQLIARQGLSASGGNWLNDGLISTDGDLDLTLTGTYGGNGVLSSLGELGLRAAGLDLGAGAQVVGGGTGTVDITGLLQNHGRLTMLGDLGVRAGVLDNHGTLGSAGALRVQTPTLRNEYGLIFSGADMTLRVDSLVNRFADIYSLGAIDLAGDDQGGLASRVDNLSASLESVGDFSLRAALLNNARDVLQVNDLGKYSAVITELPCRGPYNPGGDCDLGDNDRRFSVWQVVERDRLEVTASSAASRLMAGGNLYLSGQQLSNRSSTLAAGGDLVARFQRIENLGVTPGDVEMTRVFVASRKPDYYYYRNAARSFNDKHVPNAQPDSLEADLSSFVGKMEREYLEGRQIDPSALDGQTYAAIIQAGGAVDLQAGETLDNSVIRPHFAYVGGGSRVDNATPGSSVATLVQLNPQLPPDLAQQAVDPLALPGFSLPQGQHGLFQPSNDPGHRYLIETNPALTDLRQFLSSDYLLGLLGYDPDAAQKRLGDGLYEQRLIEQAIAARTGKRFLDGLASDEAQFRYLMDNAIASKDALNLSVGVSLSAEQVAALTHDIVWLEEREVQGEKVLVPVLYLAQARDRLAPSGALVQGQDVALISGSELHNSGTLRATANLDVIAGNLGNSGLMQAGERLQLLATDSIRNAQGGIIAGKDVTALALSGDIVNERSVTTHESADDERYQHREDLADSAARIEASGDLSLAAGRDLRNLGGALRAGGDAELGAGRHLLIAAAGEHDLRQRKGAKSRSRVESIVQHGSEVQVGGDLTASAGGDLAVVASTVKAGGDVALVAQGNVTLAAAANESHSEHHRKGGDKKVDRVDSTVRQQAAVVEAGRDVAIHAGDDLAVVGSQVRAQNDITLAAERDVNILAGKDESASYYFKSEKGSFGRSKSEQKESYDSTNVASVIEAGRDLTVNISQTAEGGLSLDGGRDVTVIGSQLKAGNDLLVGATGDVAVLSGVEEHGAYSKKTKSGFLGLSKSGKSQLKTTATQVASELGAGNDVVVAAGNDVRLRASTATAGNDVELRAGLIDKDGDINLVSANDTAYSLTEEYKKKVGMSVSDGFISVASAKKAGKEAQSSTSVGSQVSADRDATLQAERDINVLGSSISAGRNVSLDAGRDVNVLAAETASSQRDWEKHKRAGLGFSTDDNGVSVFVGGERQQEKNRLAQQTAAASQISAGQDLDLTAGRDINQVGSDLKAANDVNLQAGRDIRIDAAREREVMEHVEVYEREGLGVTVNHNFGSTKDAASNTGKGEDSVSKGSSVLKSLDSVSQFFAGPTADVKLGHSKESYSQEISSTTQRASTLSAGNDLNLSASNDVVVKGSVLEAKRDINVKGRDITLDVAKGDYTEEAQQSQSWAGIHGGTTGGIKAGIGGSHGRADQELRQGTSTVTELNAGRDINLQASNDLTLVGTLAQALRDLQLDAGNDLSIRSAQNSSDSESTRRSGGGEVGLTFGSEGVGVYFSGNLGKGNLDREGVTQQEAYLYAGNRLGFTSGRDTTIEGAQLRGDGVVGRVGRNLRVASAVDSGEVKGKEFDLDATVTIGPGSGISGSVGYGKTTGKTHWVGQQTSITAADRLDIRTEQHTQLDGALIASDTGNLKLDTGTLGFSDIRGEDKEHGYYLNVGGSYGLGGGGTQQDRSQVGKGQEGESGWSVEGYDYRKEREQIVRATVGEGEIVVRSDAETGSDSTAGLNRDVSRAYEITKDEESRTDLYVTKSSLEAVGNPKETLQKWKDGAENYGRNSVLAFTNMGVLKEQALSAAEHDKLVAALAWAPVLLVDAMDAMGTPTLGIFPGVANHGGLITQLPVLVTGDLQPMRVTGTFKTDENGQLVLKDGKPILDLDSLQVDQFVGFNDQEDKIFTNGIMNSMMEALANGLMQSGSGNGGGNFVLAYNPTHGLVGDLIESAFDKSLQGAVRSGTARNLNGLFQQGIDAGPETLHIYGHSQGGLLTWVAIKGLDFSQGKSPEVQLNTIQLSGAPVDAIQFHKDAEAAGFGDEERQRAFQINRPDESVFFSLLPKTDTVSDLPLFLGGNAQYSNDPTARTLGALFTVISLFGEDSPHSNYACVTCELSAPGGVDAQIRDIVIKPTLIDSQGNARRPE